MNHTETDARTNSDRFRTADYFLVYNRNKNSLIGRIIDLSPGGFKLISDEPIPDQTKFKCRIAFPRSIDNVREIPAVISSCWCRENKRIGMWEIGFQIKDLSEAAQAVFDKVIATVCE